MPKFRKKPIVIVAHQLDGTDATVHKILKWINGVNVYSSKYKNAQDVTVKAFRDYSPKDKKGECSGLRIQTLEGLMDATTGDWIIKGVNGEFYPCKPDIFKKTYEPVEDSA